MVWLGLFPILAVLNVTMVPRLRRLRLLVRPVPVSLVLVVWMTYLGVPLVSRLLLT
jgi:antibiotic biosynthesis monooxygenase (ABM) superfamily enzyme